MNPPPTQQKALLSRCRRLLHDHQTRARKDGQTLDYGLAQVVELLGASPCCAYCQRPVGWDVSLDHRMPTGRGGRHALANLAVCCPRCNALKGALTEAEFRELVPMLARWHPAGRQAVERRLVAGGKRYAGKRAQAQAIPESHRTA
jgi:5-methylcytosine-specific restriction endonuclease McrA